MHSRRRRPMLTRAITTMVTAALLLPAAVMGQESEEAAEPAQVAEMRFLAGNRFGPTDMLIDGEPVYEGLVFAQVSDYVDVPVGEHLLAAEGFQRAERTLDLKPDAKYTAVLVPIGGGIEIAVVADKAKPKAGQAQARVVSMCPGCGSILYDAAREKKPLAKNLDYAKGKLAGKYQKVKSGQLQLLARQKGADGPLADFDPVSLAPGVAYSLFVVGPDASGVTLAPATDAAVTGARFVNVSREPKVVDVYLDGKKVVKRLFPGQATEKSVNLLAGDHLVQVVETGKKPAEGALIEDTVAFPGGAVGVEAVAGESLEAVSVPTSRAPKAKVSQVRFAHIDPEIPAVDIDVQGMEPVLGLEAGEWTDYLPVSGNEAYVWIRPSDDPTSTLHEFPLPLGPSENLTGYLGGSPNIPTVDVVFVSDPFAKKKK